MGTSQRKALTFAWRAPSDLKRRTLIMGVQLMPAIAVAISTPNSIARVGPGGVRSARQASIIVRKYTAPLRELQV